MPQCARKRQWQCARTLPRVRVTYAPPRSMGAVHEACTLLRSGPRSRDACSRWHWGLPARLQRDSAGSTVRQPRDPLQGLYFPVSRAVWCHLAHLLACTGHLGYVCGRYSAWGRVRVPRCACCARATHQGTLCCFALHFCTPRRGVQSFGAELTINRPTLPCFFAFWAPIGRGGLGLGAHRKRP